MIKHLLLFGASLMPCTVLATDFFITPEGSGSKDGSNWENAMGLSEYYAHMQFVYKDSKPVTAIYDAHKGEKHYFSIGTYKFNQAVFVSRSEVTFNGGYDSTTGELAETGRTLFDGESQPHKYGAFYIQANGVNDIDRSCAIKFNNIDFENFVATGDWNDDGSNWQHGMPSAVYVEYCGSLEISDCNFKNNTSKGTGNAAMAGALSLNRCNTILRNCSFIGNVGTDGGAVKVYFNSKNTQKIVTDVVVDCCYFAGNKSATNGGAIYGRHSQSVNIINSTIVDNESQMGGGVFVNDSGYYKNILNIVSSTIAGNTANGGSQVYTGGKNTLRVANSIIVANGDAVAIADKTETTGYTFQGNNLIGGVAEGYTSTESDDINAANNYEAVFGSNVLAENGTLTPVKFKAGMAPADIASVVAAESWNYSVDTAVDQLGNERTTSTSNGALAIINPNTGIDSVIVSPDDNGDESWYNLQGVRFTDRPTAKGLYIHKGKKVMVL